MCYVIYMQAYISLYYTNTLRYHDYVFKYINKSTSGYTRMCHVIYMQAYISLYYNNPFRYHDYVFKYINKSTSGYTHMCHRNKHGCVRKK